MKNSRYVNRHIVALTDIELANFCGLTTASHGARIRAKCLASHWFTTSDIPAGMNIGDLMVEDVDVIKRDMLDDEHAAKFPKPCDLQGFFCAHRARGSAGIHVKPSRNRLKCLSPLTFSTLSSLDDRPLQPGSQPN
jgi:hypothetical protein